VALQPGSARSELQRSADPLPQAFQLGTPKFRPGFRWKWRRRIIDEIPLSEIRRWGRNRLHHARNRQAPLACALV